MNVLSLFDGISCGQVALRQLNFHITNYFASEIDKHAISVTQHHFPNTIQLGDVKQVRGTSLSKIDLLLAGSPCQGFSFAGKQLNFNDERSALFFEFVRILKEVTPTYFLLENVKMKKEYENIITDYLQVKPIEINSNLVSAQNRKRLYWTNIPNITHPKDENIQFKDILESSHISLSEKQIHYANTAKYERDRVIDIKSKCNTVTTTIKCRTFRDSTGTYFKLTPLECERLQTLPENYTAILSDTQRYKCLGNCWTINVIKHILSHI